MKLVLVNYEYPPLGGGAGNATACLARALVGLGHNIRVVTGAFGELRGMEQESPNLRVIRLAAWRKRKDRSNYAEMLSFVVVAARALPRLLRAETADGLIVFFSLPCGPLGWLAHRLIGIPYVISLRGGDVPGAEVRVGAMHRLLAPLRRAVLRHALAVVANSPGLARLSECSDPTLVRYIPNGVDTGFFSPSAESNADSGIVRFLFAGRFQSQKNLFVLLEQFARALHAALVPLHLTLIGDGPQRARLEAHARSLGVADVVTWSGWLSKSELLAAYRRADVFLNPSLYEGMPNTVLEAMACGLPVIASRIMGNEDLVADGETGLLYDLDRPDALGDALRTLAADAGRRAAMGMRGRAIICSHFGWDTVAAQYAKLFQRD